MTELDKQLKEALRRCDPPPHFAQRVLARAAQEKQLERSSAPPRLLRLPALRWAMAAAVIIAVSLGLGYRIREQHAEQAEALAAKRQVMLALRIASSKLRVVKQKVHAEDTQKSGHSL